MKYRRKTAVVEAFQMRQDDRRIWPDWLTGMTLDDDGWRIDGQRVSDGDWIIWDGKELYPMGPAGFSDQYEEAGPPVLPMTGL